MRHGLQVVGVFGAVTYVSTRASESTSSLSQNDTMDHETGISAALSLQVTSFYGVWHDLL